MGWRGIRIGWLDGVGEKHRAELSRKAVVYFNSDTNGTGTLNAGGSPSLQVFFSEVLRDINDPVKNKPLLEPDFRS